MIILNSIAVLTTERNKANEDVTTSKNNSKIFVTRTVTEKCISKKFYILCINPWLNIFH